MMFMSVFYVLGTFKWAEIRVEKSRFLELGNPRFWAILRWSVLVCNLGF